MPLYDFICRACGQEFETLVMGSERPRCPGCNSEELKKQMSTFARRRSGSSSGEGTDSAGGGCSGCTSSNCSSC